MLPRRRRPPHVHDVVRRAHRGGAVPGQGRDPVRPGRRRGRHGGDRARGGLRPPDRLRHGRHLDRRVAFRRRVRARLRDRGRGRAHARADDADPHGRGRRRLDPAFRRRALSRRPGFRRRQSGTDLLSPRRPARRHRRQRDGRQADRRISSRRFSGPQQDQPLDAEAVRAAFADARRRGRRRPLARGGRRRLHQDRGREHGERDQEDFGAARLRRDALCAQLLRRRRRPARLPGRRRARHDQGADPSVLVAALRLRHGARRHPRDPPAGDRGAVRRGRPARRSPASASVSATEAAPRGRRPGRCRRRTSPTHVRAHVRYAGTDTALVVPLAASARRDEEVASRPRTQARFGFIDETKQIVVEAVSVEAVGGGAKFSEPVHRDDGRAPARAGAQHPLLFGRPPARCRRLYPRPARARPQGGRARHHHRAAPDHRGRGRLAGGAHGKEPSRAGAHRGAPSASTRSAPTPIR